MNQLSCLHPLQQYRTLNRNGSSTLYPDEFSVLDMETTVSERVDRMMKALGVDQVAFAKLAGASKSVVNQWILGGIKSISGDYAYTLQKNTGYNAEWIQTGNGDEKVLPLNSKKLEEVAQLLAGKDQSQIDQAIGALKYILSQSPPADTLPGPKVGRRN